MKRLYFALIIGAVPVCSKAQNLILNPEFENTNTCTAGTFSGIGNLAYTYFPNVTHWATGNAGNPDYFNSCNPDSGFKVPSNGWGSMPARSGQAYVSIIAEERTYYQGNMTLRREYLQTKLAAPLKKDRQYKITFHVALANFRNIWYRLAGSSAVLPGALVGLNGLAANVSATRQTLASHGILPLVSHTQPTGVIMSDTTWTRVCGIYTAGGGEEWLTIGNFLPVAGTITVPYDPQRDTSIHYTCHYYIDDVTVEEVAYPQATPDTLVACSLAGFSKTLVAQPGAVSYLWSTGDTMAQITVSDSGTYWYQADYGCGLQTDTIRIRFRPFVSLNLGADTAICAGTSLTLKVPPGFSNAVWNTGSTSATINVRSAGQYILTASDVCGSQADTISLAVIPKSSSPSPIDTSVCEGTPSPLITVNAANAHWYSNINGGTGSTSQPLVSTAIPGTEQLFLTQNINGCESERVSITIRVLPKPSLSLAKDTLFCKSFVGIVGPAVTDPSYRYRWNTGDTQRWLHPLTSGSYTLTESNICGEAQASIQVDISDCVSCLLLPNAFSPNHDGRNDRFKPILRCPIYYFQMSIYNRWGQLVYKTNDAHSGWDGTLYGMDAESGVYFYQILLRPTHNMEIQTAKGDITLIR